MTTVSPDFTLSVSLLQGEVGGRLVYDLTSTCASPLFVFDILHEDYSAAGHYPLGLRGCYVTTDGDAVTISRRILEPPETVSVEQRNIPFVSRVLPGEHRNQAIDFALPLTVHTPYGSPPASGPVQTLPCFFEIGYFVGRDGTEALAKRFPTDAGARAGFDAFPASSQKIVRIGPLGRLPVALPQPAP